MRKGEVLYSLDHPSAIAGACAIWRTHGNRVRVFKTNRLWVSVELPEYPRSVMARLRDLDAQDS